jgi:putative Mg2+ transporter-C (MgtC) family protein
MRRLEAQPATAMPLHITLTDALVRLACTLIAGAVIGYNRGEHGKAAGLRTTMLVCLAAAVAMLQVNYLLPLAGRPAGSFVMNDLMRFPLGILTGVGFIGGGAILRRRNVVTGVTTAATLWFVTVIGLCFGGGQIMLGALATAVGAFVLWAVRAIDRPMVRAFRARLTVTVDASAAVDERLRERLRQNGLTITATTVEIAPDYRTYVYEVLENRTEAASSVPAFVDVLAHEPGVRTLCWRPAG